MNVVGRINGGFLLVEMQSVELKNLLLAARALKDAMANVEAFLEPTGALPPPPACAPPDELQSMAGPPPTQPTLNRAGDSICIGCNKPFVRKRKDQKCCSAKCRRKNVDRQPGKHADKAKGFQKVCTICGKKFTAGAPIAKCCSPKCVAEKNRRYSAQRYGGKPTKAAPVRQAPANSTPPPPSKEPPARPTLSREDRLDAIKAADRRLRDGGISSPLDNLN